MRETLLDIIGQNEIYHPRNPLGNVFTDIPFKVSPSPFEMSKKQSEELKRLGGSLVNYVKTIDEIRRNDGRMAQLLNNKKPEFFLIDRPMDYLFIRPDLIITETGFALCEIETSPFGLALADILNRAYRRNGQETLTEENTLSVYLHHLTPHEGFVVFSKNTSSFSGQIKHMAENLLSGENRKWEAKEITEDQITDPHIYRAFYLHEYNTNPLIRNLIENPTIQFLPSLTPQFEEKAVLAFLWDKRWEELICKRVGYTDFSHLRTVIPPTWIVGEEKYFSPGMPNGISSSIELASVSNSKRTFVLKNSGFNPKASWSEGIWFLNETSRKKATECLHHAQIDPSSTYIVQEFRKPTTVPMSYEDMNGEIHTEKYRVRLTPYFAIGKDINGELIAIKATGVEPTTYHIHARSDAINTAVGAKDNPIY